MITRSWVREPTYACVKDLWPPTPQTISLCSMEEQSAIFHPRLLYYFRVFQLCLIAHHYFITDKNTAVLWSAPLYVIGLWDYRFRYRSCCGIQLAGMTLCFAITPMAPANSAVNPSTAKMLPTMFRTLLSW